MSDANQYTHTPLGRKVLLSLVPVVCPKALAHLGEAIVDHMALTLGASPPLLGKGFKAGLVTYDLGSVPFHGARAHRLTGDAAERYYASWEHGLTPVQVQFARGVKQLMSLACYEQPEAMERIGYRVAPWIEEVKQKRLTVFKADADRQAAQILAPDPLRPNFRMDKLRPRRKAGA